MFDAAPLREQIITYIGNKRRLLPFVQTGIRQILEDEGWHLTGGGQGSVPSRHREQPPVRFVDAFAGSGVVSRMARMMGLEVHANDLEVYTAPLIRPFLELSPHEVDKLFLPVAERLGLSCDGAYGEVLSYLNTLPAPELRKNLYFARHYAPASTEEADPQRERLFYTRENALRIDAILEILQGPSFGPAHGEAADGSGPAAGSLRPGARRYDGAQRSPDAGNLARDVVLASLLYEMSVHVNTSGVMKGYHRGWGGRGKDALLRILSPIELSPLPLIDGPRGSVSTLPAESLFSEAMIGEPEIVYADPPYNMHQYGSNYHLLTTAALNDRYDPGPVARGSRAGIRRDHNRSAFCRSQRDPTTGLRECEAAFRSFLKNMRGRHLLVSYNTDGIIPPEDMTRLLSDGGRNLVTASVQGHIKFKGGKNTQSARRTREILYRVDIDRGSSREQLDGVLTLLSREERLGRLLDSYVDPDLLPLRCEESGRGTIICYTSEGAAVAKIRRDFRLAEVYGAAGEDGRLHALEAARIEKPELMERYIEKGMAAEAIHLLKSFKIRKYRRALDQYASRIREIAAPEERRRLQELLESYAPREEAREAQAPESSGVASERRRARKS